MIVVRVDTVSFTVSVLLISGPKSQVGKDDMLCDASWKGCGVTISTSGNLSSLITPGTGLEFPKVPAQGATPSPLGFKSAHTHSLLA